MNKDVLLAWIAAILLSLGFWLGLFLLISEALHHVR